MLLSMIRNLGGLRQGKAFLNGLDVFKSLKYECGVHRVQRVPQTEKSGRIHTSTVTVAVLPQPKDVSLTLSYSITFFSKAI